MEILNHVFYEVVEHCYIIQHPTEGVIVYKEWLDDSGKVIDSELRSKSGYDIDDPILFEEVCEMIDSLQTPNEKG